QKTPMRCIQTLLKNGRQQVLVEIRRAEVFVSLAIAQGHDELAGHDPEPDAQAGRKALRECLRQDDGAVTGVEAPQAGELGAVVSQFAISGVFEHQNWLVALPYGT